MFGLQPVSLAVNLFQDFRPPLGVRHHGINNPVPGDAS
jgi:hypothetical protein